MKKLLSIFLFLPSLAMAICNPFVPGSLTPAMLNNALSVGCITSGTINNAVVGNITPAAGYFTTLSSTGGISGSIAATTLSASSSVSGVGFSNYWANPPVLGASAPNIVNGSVFNGPGTGLTGTASSLSVGSAVSATNVAGGTAGAIPYQSGVGATGFISPGTATYILTSNGAGVAPTFQSAGSAYNPAAVAITGGTINGVTIGGATPAAGSFSTLNANSGIFLTGGGSNTVAGSIVKNSINGLQVNAATGSLYDASLLNPSATQYIWDVPTGTQIFNITSALSLNGKVLYSTGTPTIASGFLSSPSITPLQGTSVFIINVGATGATNVGSINMNATATPPTGWACQFTPWNVTQIATSYIIMTSTTTTISLTQYNNAQAAYNFAGNGQILAHCWGY